MATWQIVLCVIFIALMLWVASVLVGKSNARRTWLELQRQCGDAFNIFLNQCREIVRQHARTLVSQRRTKVYKDAYGREVSDDWVREVDYFVTNVVMPEINASGSAHTLMDLRNTYALMTWRIGGTDKEANRFAGHLESFAAKEVFVEVERLSAEQAYADEVEAAAPITGSDYELLCQSLLKRAGWHVTVRGGTGDQGIDLLARKGDIVLGLQCKFYDQPVGNDAVQQAFTGARILLTNIAAVVTNAGYTKAARVASEATGVLLLTTDDLAALDLRTS
jgi:restriction system protein